MDPEAKKLLEENLKLSQENNAILHKLRRSMQIRRVMSIVYWVFIIGSAVGAYYFIEPYVGSVRDAYSGAKQDLTGVQEFFQKLNDNMPR